MAWSDHRRFRDCQCGKLAAARNEAQLLLNNYWDRVEPEDIERLQRIVTAPEEADWEWLRKYDALFDEEPTPGASDPPPGVSAGMSGQ